MNKKWIATGLLSASLTLTEATKVCTSYVQIDHPTFQSLVFKDVVTVVGTPKASKLFDDCMATFDWKIKHAQESQ